MGSGKLDFESFGSSDVGTNDAESACCLVSWDDAIVIVISLP